MGLMQELNALQANPDIAHRYVDVVGVAPDGHREQLRVLALSSDTDLSSWLDGHLIFIDPERKTQIAVAMLWRTCAAFIMRNQDLFQSFGMEAELVRGPRGPVMNVTVYVAPRITELALPAAVVAPADQQISASVLVGQQAIAANCVRDKEGFFFQIDKSEEALSKEQMEFVKCGVDAAVHTVLVDPSVLEDRRSNMPSIVRNKVTRMMSEMNGDRLGFKQEKIRRQQWVEGDVVDGQHQPTALRSAWEAGIKPAAWLQLARIPLAAHAQHAVKTALAALGTSAPSNTAQQGNANPMLPPTAHAPRTPAGVHTTAVVLSPNPQANCAGRGSSGSGNGSCASGTPSVGGSPDEAANGAGQGGSSSSGSGHGSGARGTPSLLSGSLGVGANGAGQGNSSDGNAGNAGRGGGAGDPTALLSGRSFLLPGMVDTSGNVVIPPGGR
ncbi:hypothetical protein MNEG_10702, partial [Monoraphidium neglectum]